MNLFTYTRKEEARPIFLIGADKRWTFLNLTFVLNKNHDRSYYSLFRTI